MSNRRAAAPRFPKASAARLAAYVATVALVVAGCGSDDDGDAGDGAGARAPDKVAVLLPDSQSSVRWETIDRPTFQAAFERAGVPAEIQNAEGDKATQRTQAEQAITNGAKVLVLVNLDSGSGAAIAANAKAQGVKVIDYGRLTLNGDSDYYVSFDNVEVGRLQGEGLADCLAEKGVEEPRIAVLNGSPTDNAATLVKEGYDSVINPKFESGEWVEVADESVPDWDNQQALTIFEQMLQKSGNDIDGVIAANDGLANAAISALRQRELPAIPITGQDATLQGIQNILAGDQCMTAYINLEEYVNATAKLATELAKGQEPTGLTGTTDNGKKELPSLLFKPQAVTKDNIAQTVIADGHLAREDICAGDIARFCEEVGL